MDVVQRVRGRGGWRLRALLAAVVVAASAVVVQPSAPAAAAPPPGFSEVVAFSGLVSPTAVRFAPDGGIFVAEKRGVIKLFDGLGDTTATVVADLRTEVHNFWDRGLLGLALDPNYPTQPYVYALYTFDGPIGGTAPRWGTPGADGDPCPTPPGPTADGCVVSGKLVRLAIDVATPSASSTVKKDLIHDWCQQYPSHSIGDLVFGPNRTLYVSGGDGASFGFTDYGQDGNPVNPCGDPPGGVGGAMTPPTAQGGALRAQDLRTPTDPVSLSGTVIRVSPDTGLALSDNPNAAATSENARRVVAYGLRNPFRMTIRPGTDEVWLGDVGWSTWEEVNRLIPTTRPVKNFGWPCYEGTGRQAAYDAANLKLCEDLYAQTGAVTEPYYPYKHRVPLNAADNCNVSGGSSASGISFQFYTGGPYPAEYDGALFFADYSRRCIWVMTKGTNGLPDKLKARSFVTAAAGPVDLELSPRGELFYADLNGGTIRRIVHGGAGPTSCPGGQFLAEYFAGTTPTAAPVTRACEPAPLAHDWGTGSPAGVGPDNFSARWTGTFDFPAAADYTFTADADDGMRVWVDGTLLIDEWRVQTRTTFTATRALTAGTHTVRVEWFDGTGPAVANLRWSAGSPPQPQILTPAAGTTWQVGDSIGFTGSATDAEDGALPASALSWRMIMRHCPSACHDHPVQAWPGVSGGSMTAPDHEYPSHLLLELTATDSHGQSTTVSRRLDPRTVGITLASQPTGAQLTLGGRTAAAPVTGTFIQGGTTSVSATTQQILAGATRRFSGWSDGGLQSHNITAATSRTLTATYALPCAQGQYFAQYFGNATLSGTPARTACEAAPLNRGYGAGGPTGVPADNFSVRWDGAFRFTGGSTTFSGSSDNGMRVWLDGGLVVDRWTTTGAWSATRTVTAGVHTVRVDYVERTGNAHARLSWSP